ncbi:MAG: ATP-binding cassette domain-containing protein [Acidimicrobiales bacterium]
MAVLDGGFGRIRVDLQTTSGELVAVEAEPTQATALARTIVGLADPLAGEVSVGGVPVTEEDPGKRLIGYVPADDSLLPSLSVQRNIWYGVRAAVRRDRLFRDRWLGLARRHRGDRLTRDLVDRLTAALGLGPTLHLHPHELEDGQRFHVAMVRAVARKDEVIVVDMPKPIPGALRPRQVLERIRGAVDSTAILTMVVCSADRAVLAGVDRVVPVTPTPSGGSER